MTVQFAFSELLSKDLVFMDTFNLMSQSGEQLLRDYKLPKVMGVPLDSHAVGGKSNSQRGSYLTERDFTVLISYQITLMAETKIQIRMSQWWP